MKDKKLPHSSCQAFGLGVTVGFVVLLLLAFVQVNASSAVVVPSSSDRRNGSAPVDNAVITIGVAAPLSGRASSLGWQQANSVQLAVSETMDAGGIDIGGLAYSVTLVMADDACDESQAISAANSLLDAGVVAVVGHTCSGASMAAQPHYNQAGVAMISPASTDPALTQQGYNTTFRTIPHDGSPPVLMATYFSDWVGASRAAIVENPWYRSRGDFFQNIFSARGGTITGRHAVTDTSYFTEALTTIQAENPDVIANLYMDANHAVAGGQFSKIARNLGMVNVVIGWTSLSNDESILDTYASTAGPTAAEGDLAVMQWRRLQDMPGWASFLDAYQAADFLNEPDDPGPHGPFAHDAARIIIAAIDRADSTNPAAIRNEIAATKNHAGVVGTYQGFDANGDVIPQWAWLERYRDGQWQICPSKTYVPIILSGY